MKNKLIKNIESASREQNLYIIKISFLDILYRKRIIENNAKNIENIFATLGGKEKDIIQIKTKIFENIEKIDIIYREDSVDKNIGEEYFKNIRKEIHNLLIDLSRYLTEISYYHDIYYDLLSRKNYHNNININFEEFYNKVYEFLMKDESLLNEKISEIIWAVPIKISKVKYYDIIEKSFKNSFNNSSKEKVDILFKRFKSIFNGTLEWGYVDSFEMYFRIAQYFKDVDYKNLSKDELEKVFVESENNIKEIEQLIDYLREIGIIVNKFIIINILKDNLSLSEKKDITLFIRKIKNDSKNELLNRMKEMENSLIASTKIYQEITKELINNNINIDEKLQTLYKKTEKVLGYFKDYNIEREELIFQVDSIVDESYLDKSIENFIQFIDRNIRSMDNINRKIRMKKVLSILDIPFRNPDEFFDYLRSSIEFNNDRQEIQYIINEVYSIMSKYK